MHTPDTLPTVRRITAEIFEVDEANLTGSTRLMVDLPCESIDLLEISARLSQAFRIQLDDDALFLRSLRVRIEEAGPNADADAVIAAEFPWLGAERVQAIAANLSDPNPLVSLDDIAAYVAANLSSETK